MLWHVMDRTVLQKKELSYCVAAHTAAAAAGGSAGSPAPDMLTPGFSQHFVTVLTHANFVLLPVAFQSILPAGCYIFNACSTLGLPYSFLQPHQWCYFYQEFRNASTAPKTPRLQQCSCIYTHPYCTTEPQLSLFFPGFTFHYLQHAFSDPKSSFLSSLGLRDSLELHCSISDAFQTGRSLTVLVESFMLTLVCRRACVKPSQHCLWHICTFFCTLQVPVTHPLLPQQRALLVAPWLC